MYCFKPMCETPSAPHAPTYLRIVEAARKHKLAGATVLRGILGLGYHGVLKPTAWSWVEHVPIIVDVVDTSDKITKFLEVRKDIMVSGMITLERAAVMMYRHRSHDQPSALSL